MIATHDVLVIGAGPAGLYTALRLAEEGFDAVVLEEDDEIGTPTHCTGIVSAETNGFYKIPDGAVLNRPPSCLLISPSGLIAELTDPDEQITVLDRASFDRALAASVKEAGGKILTGSRVENVRTSHKFVEAVLARGELLRAKALVLACGVTFRFHALLHARLPPSSLHTAQIELAGSPANKLEVYVGRTLAPEGFAWLVPIRRGEAARLKIGVLLRGDARAHLQKFLSRPSISSRLREEADEPIRRLLPIAPVTKSYADRVVAVGDAAGLTKPVTGGGIFYSLKSAQLASETLVEALLANDLSAARLSQYEFRWREHLMPEIRTGRWFRELLAGLGDEEWDRLIAALASAEVQSVIKREARFNWHRSVILHVLKQPGIKSILLRSFFR